MDRFYERKGALYAFAGLLTALTILRLWLNSAIVLSGEEAYYWSWSRRLAWCYFDHPPLIAWLIRASTEIFGHTVFAVRFVALACHTAAAGLLFTMARRAFGETVPAAWAAILYTTAVFFGGTASLMLPDAVLFPVWALALWLVIETLRPGRRWMWMLVGVALGLAALAKFHAVLLALAITTWAVISPRQRSLFFSGWAWLGAGITLAIISPIIRWNAEHDWATFGFQMADRHKTVLGSPLYFAEMLVAPLGYIGLVTAPLCLVAAVLGLREGVRKRDDATLFLALATLVPFGFFLALSIIIRIDPQWAAPGFIAGTILAARLGVQWRQHHSERRAVRALLPVAAGTGLAMLAVPYIFVLVVQHHPEWIEGGGITPLRHRAKYNTSKLGRFYGWREIGRHVQGELDALGGVERAFIISQTGQGTSAAIEFYTPDRPEVYQFKDGPVQRHQYYIWEREANVEGRNAVVLARRMREISEDWLNRHFERHEMVEPLLIERAGRLRQHFQLVRGWGFRRCEECPNPDTEDRKTTD